MSQVYKYVIPEHFHTGVLHAFTFDMPQGATFLAVHSQDDKGCIWAMVNPEAPSKKRHFKVYGTGQHIPNAHSLVFIGTFLLQEGTFVGHVFEELAPS